MKKLQEVDTDTVRARGLPASVFIDQDIYQAERNILFAQGWVGLASAQQIPERGDALPVEIAGYSLLAVRVRDGEVRVFHNVCRHKGAPVVERQCSKLSALVCPYHRWSYKLDGDLLGAPFFHGEPNIPMTPGEKKARGLRPVRFAVWWDIIFVNISGKAVDFSSFIGPLDTYLSDYHADNLSLVGVTDYRCKANWKLAVDNFLDGYHVPFLHPQASGVKSIFGQQDLRLSDDILGLRLANGANHKPPKATKPLPSFETIPEERKASQQWFYLFPNTLFFVDPCWVQTIFVRPASATQITETLSVYVVHADAQDEGFAEDRLSLQAVLNEVNRQDIELLGKLQKTRSTEAADHGNFVECWDRTSQRFQSLWLEKMSNG